MTLGERLMNLRKEKHLSQEEVANILNVTRQTVSKWELDQSLPDFDKIMPLCKLYEISSDELLTGNKTDKEVVEYEEEDEEEKSNKEKRAGGLFVGILFYVVAIAWIMTSVAALRFNAVISAAIFLIICGLATCIIVYTQIVYKKKPTKKEVEEKKLYKQIDDICAVSTLIVYLVISFVTHAWHVTWIIWIVYALITKIIKLGLSLRGDNNESN